MTREQWRVYYRALRVATRESRKAVMDQLFYGTGVVMVPTRGDPYHVPARDFMPPELFVDVPK